MKKSAKNKVICDSTWKRFLDLSCRLSPENLSCDGELSRVEAMRKQRQLLKEWKKLEKTVGREVGEGEVWDWHMRKNEVER